MQEHVRYRVTGALFLLALGVIFVPMLFDGEGVQVDPVHAPQVDHQARAEVDAKLPAYAEVVPESNAPNKVAALRAEIDAEGFSTVDGTKFGEPRLHPVTQDTKLWAVQAGSFAKQDNAQQFRTTVRDLGYEAFISTAKDAAGRIRHRVAVGPLMAISDAQTVRDELGAKLEVTAQIMELEL